MMHYTQDLVQQLRPYFQSSAKLKSLLLKFGLTGTAVWIIARYFFYRLYLHPVNKIPGPPTDWLPLLGNALQILKADPGACQLEWTKKYGTIVSYHGPWNRPRVLISDPELVKQVLTTQEYDFVKPPETVNFLGNVLGYGVLLAEGAEHKHQRKMLNPAFSVHALRGMVPAMTVPAVHLRDEWLKLASSRPAKIDVSAGLSLATLDVIGIAGFGTEFRSVTDSELDTIGGRLSRAYRDLFLGEASLMRFIGIFVPTLRKLPTKRNQVLRRDIQTLNEETQRMIEKGRERENVAAGRDLLSLMIRQIDEDTGRGMTTQELKDQCLTFLAAGHETTSVALSWGLYLLAQHQDIQEQLRQEVKQLFQSIDTSLPFFSDFMQAVQDGKLESFVEQANIPSYDAINNLKLLNNVCKETMRLYPPVPMTNRINLKDTTLGHYYIPKGTMLFISPMVSHHDPRWWGSDVEEFRPSRWNEAPANQISPYIYLPFLAGGRQCIGYRFALMEFKVLISILILNLKFSLVPGFKPRQKQQITLRSYPALELMVEKI